MKPAQLNSRMSPDSTRRLTLRSRGPFRGERHRSQPRVTSERGHYTGCVLSNTKLPHSYRIAAKRWATLARTVDPRLPAGEDWPLLTGALDRAHAAGYHVATELPHLASPGVATRRPARRRDVLAARRCLPRRGAAPRTAAGPGTDVRPRTHPPPARAAPPTPPARQAPRPGPLSKTDARRPAVDGCAKGPLDDPLAGNESAVGAPLRGHPRRPGDDRPRSIRAW